MSKKMASSVFYSLGVLAIFISSILLGVGAAKMMGLGNVGYVLYISILSFALSVFYAVAVYKWTVTDFSRVNGLVSLFFSTLIVLSFIGMFAGWMLLSDSGNRSNLEVLDLLYPAFLLMAACVGPAMLGLLSHDKVINTNLKDE